MAPQTHGPTSQSLHPSDLFSSYSRQNLLSTKNFEMLQNLPPPFPAPLPQQPPPPKSNADHAPETAPRRNPPPHQQPPDVLNVNPHPGPRLDVNPHHVNPDSGSRLDVNPHPGPKLDVNPHPGSRLDVNPRPGSRLDVNPQHVNPDSGSSLDVNPHPGPRLDVAAAGVPTLGTANGGGIAERSNASVERGAVDAEPERRRNEWREEVVEEQASKSKLFEELRENVYKEVASLISANETRPHFLIQLFRDLQMIGSDSLRLKILQSIQAVVSHSIVSTQNSNRPSLDSQPTSSEADASHISDNFSMQPTVWSKSIKNLHTWISNNDSSDYQNILKGVVPFLNEREFEVVQSQLLSSLKKTLLESGAFKEAIRDTVFQKHFSNVLDEVLEQYCGKKVKDIKTHLLQTLNELLCGEIGFIQFIQETEPENLLSQVVNENADFLQDPRFEQTKIVSGQCVGVENMQNGDLAEADQTRMNEEDMEMEEEEEGAVGGILEQPSTAESHGISQGTTGDNMELICSSEGLDQVPTRLLTKSKSRSTTPSRDRSNSRADPDSF